MTHAPARSIEIALVGMRFHVRVGILPHERELPQPLEIDLRVRHPHGGALLDYRRLHAAANDALRGDPVELLEDVATAIVSAALALEGVQWARVAVRKPHVALAGPLQYAEVVLEGSNA